METKEIVRVDQAETLSWLSLSLGRHLDQVQVQLGSVDQALLYSRVVTISLTDSNKAPLSAGSSSLTPRRKYQF